MAAIASARLLVSAVVVLGASLHGAHPTANADSGPSPQVSVREDLGTYVVAASFDVPQAAGVALAVLSDYEQIPRFMPDVRTSVVLERSQGRLLVAQEAVSKFMMFSRTVHLLLEVTEEGDTITFVDRGGKSFTTYAGAWRAVQHDGGTTITYALTARPAFEVSGFVLKRLLKRDSADMIDRLRREIAAREAR